MNELIDHAKEYYEVLNDDLSDRKTAKIKIVKGKFEGIIYYYDVVKIKDEDKANLTLDFSYEIDHQPEDISVEGEEVLQEFEQTIGDILVSFIISSEDMVSPHSKETSE